MSEEQLLSEIQVQELKVYFGQLDVLREIIRDDDDFSDLELSEMINIHALIGKFGEGDPIKAAEVHHKAVRWAKKEVERKENLRQLRNKE